MSARQSAGAAGAGRPLVQRLTEEVDARRLPYRLVLAALGLVASAYLTWLHFAAAAPVGCPEGGLVNCVAVLTSPESSLLGVPVAAFGLVFFAGALATLELRRRASSPLRSQASLVWMVGGAAAVVTLVYTELFVVDRICLWCSFTHAMALGLFALELWPIAASDDARADARRRARQAEARQAEARNAEGRKREAPRRGGTRR
jgi:uncharacterized membrane protein